VIAVFHDLNLAAMYADRLLLLKGGKKEGIGPPNEVLTRLILERTYGCDLVIDRNPTRDVPRISLVRGEG
jgi:iron complex transport system ATP-binding protein